ncbi:MAG: WYL domain-containing protein [Pseudohongiellaceae bacterium]
MEKIDRIFKLHRLLTTRRTPLARATLQEKLGCSRATLTRLIRDCRDFLHLPNEYDKEHGGYFLDRQTDAPHELPGLWFSSAEIHALLTSHRLLAEVKPGLLEPYITPLKDRLEALLQHKQAGSREIFERIRILPMASREARLEDFQTITDALVKRRQLRIQYSSRGKDELSERWVSPQRLIYYRDNWYLDAWCHSRKALRTFSVDRMNVAEQGEAARDIADEALDRHFTSSYGIFAGPARHEARIRFTNKAARWVADEQWHPQQSSQVLPDGGIELLVPYGDATELMMDILKYGPDAEVIAPASLRKLVEDRLSQTLRAYRNLQ